MFVQISLWAKEELRNVLPGMKEILQLIFFIKLSIIVINEQLIIILIAFIL